MKHSSPLNTIPAIFVQNNLEMATWLNNIGVIMILIAFILLSMKIINSEHPAYKWLNFVGAGFTCVGAYMLGVMAFVVMEAIWSAVALYSIIRK